ncbi:hypothetical protein QCA50_007124 [Cerrena zonata]|uniref:Uncharacterized protein n=1 Tax=Cerrena zonata TaxID=2478898 RepID=A0AAW0G6P5_9APHY
MPREIIRSNPNWRNEFPRYDIVLVRIDPDLEDMRGMIAARVKRFISFTHDATRMVCAVVEWFVPYGDGPDPITGMWIVKLEIKHGKRVIGIVHLDCIS